MLHERAAVTRSFEVARRVATVIAVRGCLIDPGGAFGGTNTRVGMIRGKCQCKRNESRDERSSMTICLVACHSLSKFGNMKRQ